MTYAADLAESLAPPRPPCFPSRAIWIAWVRSAADCERIVGGDPPRFNRSISFCADCCMAYRAKHLKAGTCQPQALTQEATA